MKLHHFKKETGCIYQIGAYIGSNYNYIQNAAEMLYKIYKDKEISLVCRGSSGIIIASGIYILLRSQYNKNNVNIVISRKDIQSCHGYNMAGLYLYKNSKIVLVDDFLDSGETIKTMLADLDNTSRKRMIYDMLILSNNWNYKKLESSNLDYIHRFTHVVCNR